MGEDGQGNLIRIGRTKDSPHIWATRNGEHSMESVLLFARYELREGRLICIPYRGDVPIVFEQTE